VNLPPRAPKEPRSSMRSGVYTLGLRSLDGSRHGGPSAAADEREANAIDLPCTTRTKLGHFDSHVCFIARARRRATWLRGRD